MYTNLDYKNEKSENSRPIGGRGKNFLVSRSELRNSGEGENPLVAFSIIGRKAESCLEHIPKGEN